MMCAPCGRRSAPRDAASAQMMCREVTQGHRLGRVSVSQQTNSTSTSAIRVEGLEVSYGGFKAVAGLDLDVAAGSVHGLIGPNGAGKTSSFNAICGYVPRSSGRVLVHGREFTRPSPRRAWRLGLGRTFQRVELFWTLSVREHLTLTRRLTERSGRRCPDVDELLSQLGLEAVADVTVASLPLGTCRLVEFARAIATGADVILLDEPCSGLDRAETTALHSSLELLRRELDLTLLIVEHDLEFVLEVADRLTVLDSGVPIACGTSKEIQENAAVRAAYLGGGHTVRETVHDGVAS